MYTKPVRTFDKKKKGSYRGIAPSWKKPGATSTEAFGTETACAILLETNPDVVTFCEQPYTFEIDCDGKTFSYTPDFYVKRRSTDRPLFIETKPWEKTERETFKAWHKRVRQFFRGRGEDFVVLTELELHRQPRLGNAKLIYQRSMKKPVLGQHIRLTGLCKDRLVMTFGELQDLAVANDNLPGPYCMIRSGMAEVDMSEPLTEQSVVTIKSDWRGMDQ